MSWSKRSIKAQSPENIEIPSINDIDIPTAGVQDGDSDDDSEAELPAPMNDQQMLPHAQSDNFIVRTSQSITIYLTFTISLLGPRLICSRHTSPRLVRPPPHPPILVGSPPQHSHPSYLLSASLSLQSTIQRSLQKVLKCTPTDGGRC